MGSSSIGLKLSNIFGLGEREESSATVPVEMVLWYGLLEITTPLHFNRCKLFLGLITWISLQWKVKTQSSSELGAMTAQLLASRWLCLRFCSEVTWKKIIIDPAPRSICRKLNTRKKLLVCEDWCDTDCIAHSVLHGLHKYAYWPHISSVYKDMKGPFSSFDSTGCTTSHAPHMSASEVKALSSFI